MVSSSVVVSIKRPLADVFAFVANAETAPQWRPEIAEVQRTTAAPIGVGTTYQARRRHLNEWRSALVEILEYEPLTTVVFESSVGLDRMRESYTFLLVAGSTRVTCAFAVTERARSSRFAFNAEAAALSRLKDILETPGPARRPGPAREL
jgi:hypothetical protein